METKIIINSGCNKGRDNWYSLVQTSKGYAIEHKENRRATPVNYHEVSVRFAHRIGIERSRACQRSYGPRVSVCVGKEYDLDLDAMMKVSRHD